METSLGADAAAVADQKTYVQNLDSDFEDLPHDIPVKCCAYMGDVSFVAHKLEYSLSDSGGFVSDGGDSDGGGRGDSDQKTDVQNPILSTPPSITRCLAICDDAQMVVARKLRSSSSASGGFGPSNHNTVEMARYMDPQLYRAAITGDIKFFEGKSNDPEVSTLGQVTPQENTVLHIAASLGYHQFVKLILQQRPDLFKTKNATGHLALHLAASAGHLYTVKSLVQHYAGNGEEEMVTNEEKNTALCVALENHHKEVAEFLVEADPDGLWYLNKEGKGKSPLYLAAKEGYLKLVKLMTEKLVRSEGVDETAVHAAIVGKNIDVLDAICNKWPTLIRSTDEEGRTPLSFAASLGCRDGVRYLLTKSNESTYLRDTDKNGFFSIHAASSRGHIKIIQEFLLHCPDSMELLNRRRQNILHVAVWSGKANVVNYVLKTHELEKLINARDDKGNSPLHLAAKCWDPRIVSILTWDNRVSLELVNDEGLTALDVAEKFILKVPPLRQVLTVEALKSVDAPRSGRRSATKGNSQSADAPRSPRWSGNSQSSLHQLVLDQCKERVNTLLLVSTLVATVTFAAGFTMPGGYNSSDPHQGMATLVTKHTFHAFLICNTIAMYSAITVTATLIWAQLNDLNLVLNALKVAVPLLGFAVAMMSLAYMAGVYLVVGNLNWLAIVVLIVGLFFLVILVLLFLPLCHCFKYINRISRPFYHYYFYLVTLATSSKDYSKE